MGLLDDAIREHLELKRRRGADPSEIAREETEALGPVRREARSEDDAAPPAGSYADHDPAALDEPGAAYDDEPYADDDEPEAYSAAADHLVPSDPPATHDQPYAEREDESATPPHGDPLAPQQPTREFSATELDEALGSTPRHESSIPPTHTPPIDAVPSDEDEAENDDELEETPDFLQETPEHDRLWFEQKPPKDFDF
jgi:hypothetical protein